MTTSAEALKGKLATAGTSKAMTIHDQKSSMIPQFAMLLNGNTEKAERAFRIAVTEYNKSASLQQCDRKSFWGCVINAVQMNLEPGPLGYAYLIPYKGICTLQIGYKGMLELVSRSEKVDSVYAYPVYKGDRFKFTLGSNPNIDHTPDIEASTTDIDIIAFYAVAHIKGCSIPRIEVMSRNQVDAIRKRAQAGNSGPWVTDYAEMGRKTVLKRLCKTLPLSVESQRMLAVDETVRKNLDANIDDTTSVFDIMAEDVTSNTPTVEAVDVKKDKPKPVKMTDDKVVDVVPEGVNKETGEVEDEPLFG